MGNNNSVAAEQALKERADRFLHGDITSTDSGFWTFFLNQPVTVEQIEEVLPDSELRRLRIQKSMNLELFLFRILAEITRLINKGTYGVMSASDNVTAVTSLRLLTHLMRILLEDETGNPSEIQVASSPAAGAGETIRARAEGKRITGASAGGKPENSNGTSPASNEAWSKSKNAQHFNRTKSPSGLYYSSTSSSNSFSSNDDASDGPEEEFEATEEPLEGHEGNFVQALLWNVRPSFELPYVPDSSAEAPAVDDVSVDHRRTDRKEERIFAVRLITALQRMLFLHGFTLNNTLGPMSKTEVPPRHKVDSRFVWTTGIGTSVESVNEKIIAPVTLPILQHRAEVLRALLCCCCGASSDNLSVRSRIHDGNTVYHRLKRSAAAGGHLDLSNDTVPCDSSSLWLWVLTRGYVPLTANLFCSLLSSVAQYPSVQASFFQGSTASREEEKVVTMALQFLCLAINFNSGAVPSADAASGGGVPNNGASDSAQQKNRLRSPSEQQNLQEQSYQANLAGKNAYRLMIAGLRREGEIDLLFEAFVRQLGTFTQSKKRHLIASSPQPFRGYIELLILLWYLVTLNPTFLSRIASKPDILRLLEPLLVILVHCSKLRRQSIESKQQDSSPSTISSPVAQDEIADQELLESPASHATTEQQQHSSEKDTDKTLLVSEEINGAAEEIADVSGLLHLTSFILLVLSSERSFAVALNTTCHERLPLDGVLQYKGSTYADILIVTLHNVVVDSLAVRPTGNLIGMLLTILCNVSAYIRTFRLESSSKILNLLSRFARKDWIFSAPHHYNDVFFLLDIINNAVQYQYTGNLCLVYSILRRAEIFHNLRNLSFPALPDLPPSLVPNWQPTESWFNEWRVRMPVHTVIRLISALLPSVERECAAKGLLDQESVMEYLEKETLVGLLPVPHPIIIRSYLPNIYTALWFSSFTTGIITRHIEMQWDIFPRTASDYIAQDTSSA